jgi:hypothetical protein
MVIESTRQSGDKSRNAVAAHVESCDDDRPGPFRARKAEPGSNACQQQAFDKLETHDPPPGAPSAIRTLCS